MKQSNKYIYHFIIFLFMYLVACTGNPPLHNEVVVQEFSDPETMNPVNFTDANSGYIVSHVFQKLIDVDYKNPSEFVPVLAVSLPLVEKIQDKQMRLTFELRKEAMWDNGSPVTAKDVEFTLKTIKCPLVNNPNAKTYFDFISDFVFYNDNPKKFTVISKEIYFLAEATFTDIPVLPEYLYDPKGLMKKFTVKMIAERSDSLKSDGQMKEFSDDFNSEKRMRDPNFIAGSGAYKFAEWKTNEQVVLAKKENWWGAALQNENCFFNAFPDKLIYRTIKDETTALVALKAGNLDVMHAIKSKDFIELPKSEKFINNFNAYTPMEYSYSYIGLNTTKPLLADKFTRQALAYLTDVDNIIKTIKYGYAERVIGPIHPSKKKAYNSSIQPYIFDPVKTKELLAKAGWKNTNGDETLDKMMDGKRTEFVIDFITNTGSDEKKSIALMFQEQAKKVGITVNVLTLDWPVFLEKCRNHQFDIMIGKLVSGPGPDELKQNFYSNSASGDGTNYSNFSNREADALMDSIQTEINEDRRNEMYMRLQEIFHEEVPAIFLYSSAERIAISKKFDNAYPSVLRPGFWEQGFRMKTASSE